MTLTANDSWPELKQILSNNKNKSSIMNPVEVSEYFFQRLYLMMEHINSKKGMKNFNKKLVFSSNKSLNLGIFGKVNHYWIRIECQNRGSLHAHMLFWLNHDRKDLVQAEIPTASDPYNTKLREYVQKYQIHKCVPTRCFKSKNNLFKCKYGFPYDIIDSDKLSVDGSRFYYKRTKTQDKNVVPYNAKLLLMWQGHVNVQYVTKRGIEQYLVKYIFKEEPTFVAREVTEMTEVQKYFRLR